LHRNQPDPGSACLPWCRSEPFFHMIYVIPLTVQM
jgi:hypothetical protein